MNLSLKSGEEFRRKENDFEATKNEIDLTNKIPIFQRNVYDTAIKLSIQYVTVGYCNSTWLPGFYFNKCKLLHKSIFIIPPDIQYYSKHCNKHVQPHSKFRSTHTACTATQQIPVHSHSTYSYTAHSGPLTQHVQPHSTFRSTHTARTATQHIPVHSHYRLFKSSESKRNSVYSYQAKSSECQHLAITSDQLCPCVYSFILNSCNTELPLSHTNTGNEKLTGVHNYWNTDGEATGQLQYIPTFSVL